MLGNSWFKKEKPFLGLIGLGGGVGSNLVGGGPTVVEVTGGTTIDDTTHWISVFTANGPATYTLTASAPLSAEFLMVGGGGAGGGNAGAPPNYGGGGGGAGGMISEASYTIVTGSHAVSVGQGGASVTSGTPSTFVNDGTTVVAYGGGRGAYYTPPSGAHAYSGGSGGGAQPYSSSTSEGIGDRQTGALPGTPIPPYPGITPGQGYPGAHSGAPRGGGGGGAGEAGHAPPSPTPAAGGFGKAVSWIPASYGTPGPSPGRWFAGGGGGGVYSPTSGTANPGAGGGGQGGYCSGGTSGDANTGGGGGGSGCPSPDNDGEPGGSGIIAIRVPKSG